MTRLDPATRCQHRNADGFQCRMARSSDHAGLCSFHARREQRAPSRPTSDSSGVPIPALQPLTLSIPRDFRSAAAINHFIGKLVIEVSHDRVDTRKAAVLGYLCQLLLQSVTGLRRESWNDPQKAEKLMRQLLDDAEANSHRATAKENAASSRSHAHCGPFV
jgi:hypothetical protein